MVECSVVIPLNNEENVVTELVQRTIRQMELLFKHFEIILIDDGSNDNTWKIIKSMALTNLHVIGIKFSKNFGQHLAISTGLKFAKGQWVVVMDGDLQDKPEAIKDLYNKTKLGFEVVFAARTNRKVSWHYLILQKLFYLILNSFSSVKYDSRFANFSIISKSVVQDFNRLELPNKFYMTTVLSLGYKFTSVEIEQEKRFSGIPSYNLKSRLGLAVNVLNLFTSLPITLMKFNNLLMIFIATGIFLEWVLFKKNYVFQQYPLIILIFLLVTQFLVLNIQNIMFRIYIISVKKNSECRVDEVIDIEKN